MRTYEQMIQRIFDRQAADHFTFTERERKGLSYENGPKDPERRIATIVARVTLPNHARI